MAEEKTYLTGNEVVAHAAIAAGCNFFAGYPITPSSEVAHDMARMLPKHGGTFIQMEDEIAAMGAVIGASLAGAKTLTATSGPGFSLKQENIGFACIAEVPSVIVNVMRGGPSTGLPTHPAQADLMQAKWGTHGDHSIIAVAPAYLQEVYTETIRCFNLAEKYRTPVILLLDEVLGHLTEGIVVPKPGTYEIFDRVTPDCPPEEYYPYDTSKGMVPPMAAYFEGYRFHVTGLNHDKTGFPTTNPDICNTEEIRMIDKIEKNVADIESYEEFNMEDAEIALVSFGSTARAAKVAVMKLREEGIKAGMFRPITVWPFPLQRIRSYRKQLKAVVVAEMNLGQMTGEVEKAIGPDIPITGVYKIGGAPIEPFEIVQKALEAV